MSVERSTIDAQLREIGEGERWWEEREFRDLPYILDPDERIHGVVHGKLIMSRRPRALPSAHWLIVATSQRLVCLKRERVGRQQVDIDLGQVTRLQHRNRMRGVQITLDTPHRRYRIRVSKEDAFRFIGALARVAPSAVAAGTAATLERPGSTTIPGHPGLSRLVSRVLPAAPGYVTRDELRLLETAVARLEADLERTRQHVEFLEGLLQERADHTAPYSIPGGSAGP